MFTTRVTIITAQARGPISGSSAAADRESASTIRW